MFFRRLFDTSSFKPQSSFSIDIYICYTCINQSGLFSVIFSASEKHISYFSQWLRKTVSPFTQHNFIVGICQIVPLDQSHIILFHSICTLINLKIVKISNKRFYHNFLIRNFGSIYLVLIFLCLFKL